MSENTYRLLQGECTCLMKELPTESVDAIITDPPYLYLKEDKRQGIPNIDVPFDEEAFFSEAKRVLKPTGFLVYFGRGIGFYRWGTIADKLGFHFKEEIIWNKCKSSTPYHYLKRMHESIACFAKKKTNHFNTCFIPYIEGTNLGDTSSIEDATKSIKKITKDIKRLLSGLNNKDIRKNIMTYLEDNINSKLEDVKIKREFFDKPVVPPIAPSITTELPRAHMSLYTFNTIIKGVKEGSIINILPPSIPSIWEASHVRSVWHPTEKPVRLIERLIALTTKEGDVVLDAFMGSGSTGVACKNMGRNFIGMELNKHYYHVAKLRVEKGVKKYPYQKNAMRSIEEYVAFLESLVANAEAEDGQNMIQNESENKMEQEQLSFL